MKGRRGGIVAIGGGDLGKLETLPIDRRIVGLSRKARPRALFVPTASGDSEGYWEAFKQVYGGRLGCRTDVLFLLGKRRPARKEIGRKISIADIIYVGGGNTLRMIRLWRRLGIDVLLAGALSKGCVLCGLSAGAICWFRYGTSDSRKFWAKPSSRAMRVSGLGFVWATFSPHHRREKVWRDRAIARTIGRTPGAGLAVDDCAAIEISGSRYRILRSRKSARVFKVMRRGRKISRTRPPGSGALADLLS